MTQTPDPLCPNCGMERQDPASKNGWGPKCDARRQRTLESKLRWWHNNRGRYRRPQEEEDNA